MVPPDLWLAMSHFTTAALRLPALKSTAWPLECFEILPVPAMRAPGLQVEMICIGPKLASMRPNRARVGPVRHEREVPALPEYLAPLLWWGHAWTGEVNAPSATAHSAV